MKFLIMPDSFKESLAAPEVAEVIKKAFKEVFPTDEIISMPIGDGGEGTLDALRGNLNLRQEYLDVTGWDFKSTKLRYMFNQDSAFIEMADLVGLSMVPLLERNPLQITTIGLGQAVLLLEAKGFKKIYIGIGGTASIDGGIGFAAGLGYEFYDENNNKLSPVGESLFKVARIEDRNVQARTAKIYGITDVKNYICGIQGAANVFGPQKGLKNNEIQRVDKALEKFYLTTNPHVLDLIGSGAGGGFSAGLVSFADGQIIQGIQFILEVIEFDKLAEDADFIIVGEGKIDNQSLAGKAPIGIAERAPKHTKVIAICGSVDADTIELEKYNISAIFPIIGQPGELKDILNNSVSNLYRTSYNVASLIKNIGG